MTDDEIALEQLEVVILELSAVSSTGDECNIVHIEPHKTTIIYVEDDDSEFAVEPHNYIDHNNYTCHKEIFHWKGYWIIATVYTKFSLISRPYSQLACNIEMLG